MSKKIKTLKNKNCNSYPSFLKDIVEQSYFDKKDFYIELDILKKQEDFKAAASNDPNMVYTMRYQFPNKTKESGNVVYQKMTSLEWPVTYVFDNDKKAISRTLENLAVDINREVKSKNPDRDIRTEIHDDRLKIYSLLKDIGNEYRDEAK